MEEEAVGLGRVEAVAALVPVDADCGAQRLFLLTAAQGGDGAALFGRIGAEPDEGADVARVGFGGGGDREAACGMAEEERIGAEAREDRVGLGLQAGGCGMGTAARQVDGAGVVAEGVEGRDQPVPAPA